MLLLFAFGSKIGAAVGISRCTDPACIFHILETDSRVDTLLLGLDWFDIRDCYLFVMNDRASKNKLLCDLDFQSRPFISFISDGAHNKRDGSRTFYII